ncbi:MAG: MGMT family protein [Pseudomonadales bacterium]
MKKPPDKLAKNMRKDTATRGPKAGEGRIVGPGFNERVYRIVQTIPRGSVATYGDVAAALGDANVARHVGWALAALRTQGSGNQYNSESVPWHRVVNARGTISPGGNPSRPPEQARRLRKEGVAVSTDNKLALERFRIRQFSG